MPHIFGVKLSIDEGCRRHRCSVDSLSNSTVQVLGGCPSAKHSFSKVSWNDVHWWESSTRHQGNQILTILWFQIDTCCPVLGPVVVVGGLTITQPFFSMAFATGSDFSHKQLLPTFNRSCKCISLRTTSQAGNISVIFCQRKTRWWIWNFQDGICSLKPSLSDFRSIIFCVFPVVLIPFVKFEVGFHFVGQLIFIFLGIFFQRCLKIFFRNDAVPKIRIDESFAIFKYLIENSHVYLLAFVLTS